MVWFPFGPLSRPILSPLSATANFFNFNTGPRQLENQLEYIETGQEKTNNILVIYIDHYQLRQRNRQRNDNWT